MERLTEASTWAGVAVLLEIASKFTPAQWAWIPTAAAAAAATAAVKLREAGRP